MSIRTGISKSSGQKVKIDEIDPGDDYKCEMCDGNLVAKRGRLVIHHFAHEHLVDCDQWRENKSKWHILWQDLCYNDFVEVSFRNVHQADIVNTEKKVIEIQNSPMSIDMMEERERFYGDMIWIVNATTVNDRDSTRKLTIVKKIKWAIIKVFHRFWLHSSKDVFIHTNFGLFHIRKPLGNWHCIAELVRIRKFLQDNLQGILKNARVAPQILALTKKDIHTMNDHKIHFFMDGMYVFGRVSDAEVAMLRHLDFKWRKYPHNVWVLSLESQEEIRRRWYFEDQNYPESVFADRLLDCL